MSTVCFVELIDFAHERLGDALNIADPQPALEDANAALTVLDQMLRKQDTTKLASLMLLGLFDENFVPDPDGLSNDAIKSAQASLIAARQAVQP